jgi:hypothetical protein
MPPLSIIHYQDPMGFATREEKEVLLLQKTGDLDREMQF